MRQPGSSVDDVDHSAGLEFADLITYVHQPEARFGLARADDSLLATLHTYGVLDQLAPDRIFSAIDGVIDAWTPDRPPGQLPTASCRHRCRAARQSSRMGGSML